MLKSYLNGLYKGAEDLNTQNVKDALSLFGPHKRLLDVGCWDGVATEGWISAAKSVENYGIEPVVEASKKAELKGIHVSSVAADKDVWPFEDGFFDCVVSNQVVEHLSDVDHFFNQASRVLKKGGYFVTSTNNLSSVHNMVSVFMGYAPFDLTNCSKKIGGVGNPFALHQGESDPRGSSWTHKCVYTPKWLFDWQSVYGFEPVTYFGSGFYPFPASVGKLIKKYSAFITTVTKKL